MRTEGVMTVERMMTMKRLFRLRSPAGDPHRYEDGQIVEYEKKRVAKAVRDTLIEITKVRWMVTLGPDHWLYRGDA